MARPNPRRPMLMHKERANARRIMRVIKFRIIAVCLVVAPEKRFAFTPTAATDEFVFACRAGGRRSHRRRALHHEVSSIADQLAVHPKDRSNSCLHLRRGIMGRLQSAHGKRNQRFNCSHVILARKTQRPLGFHVTRRLSLGCSQCGDLVSAPSQTRIANSEIRNRVKGFASRG